MTSPDPADGGRDPNDLLGPVWRERMRKLGTPGELAARLRVEPRTVASWLRNTKPFAIPKLGNLLAIATAFPYPILQQLVDAGQIDDRLSPYAKVPTSESLTHAVNTLWTAIEQLNTGRPGPDELAREVLSSCEADGVPGRWRCRLFDVPSGRRYPHVAYRGVEFQFGPDAEGRLPEHWDDTNWKDRKIDPRAVTPTPWIDRCITSTEDVEPSPEVGWQRLELLYRLREKLPLVQGQWFGEAGTLHSTLLLHRHSLHRRHLYLVRAYQERPPDPTHREVPKSIREHGIGRILVIGPLSVAPDSIARILAEGLAAHGTTGRELAARYSGRVRGYQDPYRVPSFTRMYEYLSRCTAEPLDVIGLHDLDTMMEPDGSGLRPEVRAMLNVPGTLTVLLRPTVGTLAMWRQRQEDQALPWPGARDSRPNTPDHTLEFLAGIEGFLTGPEFRQKAMRFAIPNDLPWFDKADPVFEDPDIGDYRVRTAYQLAYRLIRGRHVPSSNRSPIHLANGSLLQRMHTELQADPDVFVLEKATAAR